MPTDNVSWRAKRGIYNKLQYQTQGRSKLKAPLLFLKVHLFFINYIFVRLFCCISHSALRFLTNFLKVIDFEIRVFAMYQTLLILLR